MIKCQCERCKVRRVQIDAHATLIALMMITPPENWRVLEAILEGKGGVSNCHVTH